MSEHVTDYLSEYLDEELGSTERATVDAHIGTCAVCAAELEKLRRLVAYAGTITDGDVAPARDLWPGIRARIEHGSSERVTHFSDAKAKHAADATRLRASRYGAARRVSFSVAQLAAAAALLIAVSGAAAWYLRGNARIDNATATPVIEAEVEPTAPASEARLVNFADAQYDAAVSDLERALQERRNDLNPRTVQILERNLKLIDAAIAQARQALEEDPGNMYLNRHLVESRRRKLELLRRATAITEGD